MDDDLTRHHEAVVRFVGKFIRGDRFLAEDMAQEAFLRAHSATRTGDGSALTWLCAIALNLVRDHFRRLSRRPEDNAPSEDLEAFPASVDIEASVLVDEMDACVRSFVFDLPERQRTMVALHDLAGHDLADVAAFLGVEPGNARVILHRGRKALRERMTRDCELSFDDAVPCARRGTARQAEVNRPTSVSAT